MLTAPPSLGLPPVAAWPSPPSPTSWTPPPPLPSDLSPLTHHEEEEGGERRIGGGVDDDGGGEEERHTLPLSLPPPFPLSLPSFPLPSLSPFPPVLVVTSSDLTYRGEGADHVVLGLRKLGQVLRLRKTCLGTFTSREELVNRAARDQEVLSSVGRALLGRLLTNPAHLVLVSPRPDSALCDTLLPWRKGHRQDKQINPHGIACMCPDATTIFIPRQDTAPAASPLPPVPTANRGVTEAGVKLGQPYPREASTVCIEIKPKQGFLDSSTPGLPLCRYCVKQFLKGGRESGSRSSYCPLDLFSGNLERMRRAVDSLIQCPQNNFKVFVDGRPMEDSRPFHYLRDTIIAALTFDLTTGQPTTTSGKLNTRSALGRILTFQSLDQLGVFRASKLYLTLCDLLGTPEAVDKALSDLSAWSSPALDLTTPVEEEEEEVEVMVNRLQSYLLSTTAKDLSLMILLSGPHYSPAPHTPPGTSPFIIRVETDEVAGGTDDPRGRGGAEEGGEARWNRAGGTNENSEPNDASETGTSGRGIRGGRDEGGEEKWNRSNGTDENSELNDTSGMRGGEKTNAGGTDNSGGTNDPGGARTGGSAWFRCQVTGVDIVAKPTSKILKHQRDYERLRDLLADLRMRGEEPPCCRM
ncbi:inositol-pentakisphosphate 2-kinase-like isoform X2 [Eriocheir sinensis]|nr:inositol-pentakisphosphate 2-kinase-like isoform X2 [Eriocheir sinensis]